MKDRFLDKSQELIRNSLLLKNEGEESKAFDQLSKIEIDPLLFQLSCLEIEGDPGICIDKKTSFITSVFTFDELFFDFKSIQMHLAS